MTNIVKQKYIAELNGKIEQHQDVSTTRMRTQEMFLR